MRCQILPLFLILGALQAAVLDEATVLGYLGPENRHVAILERGNAIAREQVNAAQGSFDVTASGRYEEKSYPKSEAEYREVALSKRFESGVELETLYRYAEGTQEYNNIKTGDDGEYLLAVKVPLVELFEGINPHSYSLENARMQERSQMLTTRDRLRLFRFDVLKRYYTLLYHHQKTGLRQGLAARSRERESYISRKVDEGQFAPIVLSEAKAITAEYAQTLLQSRQEVVAERYGLCYLLDTSCEIVEGFELPKLPEATAFDVRRDDALEQAYSMRPDLKALQLSQESVRLSSELNEVSRLPKSALSYYSLYDPIYEEGYKVTFSLEIPLQRNRYEAKSRENLERLSRLREEEQLRRAQISNEIARLYMGYENAEAQLALINEQCRRYAELVEAARIRFELGGTSLLELNQQETRLLLAREKALQTRLQLQLTRKAIAMQTGAILESDK